MIIIFPETSPTLLRRLWTINRSTRGLLRVIVEWSWQRSRLRVGSRTTLPQRSPGRFTSVFGMGTGPSSQLWPPTPTSESENLGWGLDKPCRDRWILWVCVHCPLTMDLWRLSEAEGGWMAWGVLFLFAETMRRIVESIICMILVERRNLLVKYACIRFPHLL